MISFFFSLSSGKIFPLVKFSSKDVKQGLLNMANPHAYIKAKDKNCPSPQTTFTVTSK